MVQCNYSTPYRNIETDEEYYFECKKKANFNGKCKLHDLNYVQKHPKKIQKIIADEVNDAINNNTPLECFGYFFPPMKIQGKFTNQVYFTNATFLDEIHFSFSTFTYADFSNVTFNKLFMINSTIQKKINFSNCHFNNNVDFIHTKFNEMDVLFSKFKNASFTDVEAESVKFYRTDFEALNFNVKKIESVKFDQSNFKRGFFASAEFGYLEFRHIKSQFANFQQVKTDRAIFYNIEFDESLFIEFQANVSIKIHNGSFEKSNFEGAIFQKLEFESSKLTESNFSRAQFKNKSHFKNITFEEPKKINFDVDDLSNVSFLGTDISRIRFGNRTIWGGDESFKIIDEILLDSIFQKEKKVLIEPRFISREDFSIPYAPDVAPSYSIINLSKYTGNRYYATRPRLAYHPPNKQFRGITNKTIELILPEEQISQLESENKKEKIESIRLGGILAIYRNLRENNEYRLRYEEAGNFFVREMEVKRKYQETKFPDGSYRIEQRNWFKRNLSFAGLYYHLSKYGESYYRPLGFLVLIIIGSMLYFWGVDVMKSPDKNYISIDFSDDFKRSIANLVPTLQMENTNLSDYVEKIAVLPILGSLFIALRRKLERRFRH